MPSECKNKVPLPPDSKPSPSLPNTLTAKEAGQAFESAAAIQTKHLNEPDDAANTLVEAFKVYRKSEPAEAARVIDAAINQYTAKGNFRRAATHKQNQAEVFEELGEQKKAIEAYELAASWFEGDNAEA
jgi:alpha-soluble NSF attachment protein